MYLNEKTQSHHCAARCGVTCDGRADVDRGCYARRASTSSKRSRCYSLAAVPHKASPSGSTTRKTPIFALPRSS
ncbi:hypothetical protein E2C01_062027 [Portunus trituberculatus]|uniref:Uncharacterized protein n=1 Tax=Portunus trituberculatus TaxID=210409 RepID=A0A5B7H5E5_PORTR|nr:hypothetical protein [Portunus trituberculatus]